MWSPSRLAELAGTSRRTVRHYHQLGLLPAPERRSNGYQHYGVDHLIRLIRIRRLAGLGLTLPQIAAVGDTDRVPPDVLRDLEAEVGRSIDRLQATRAELVAMIEQAAPIDVPGVVARRVEGLPAAERALVVVLTRLLGPQPLDAYLDLLAPYRAHAAVIAFDNLPADAEGAAREVVATGVADHLRELSALRPAQMQLIDAALQDTGVKRRTVQEAVGNLYNPAQLDVLARALRRNGRPRPAGFGRS
ncbi:MerR family transcriptional regulator [Pseudonocardia sp. HH130630-07]|uniref:MerR family transcriptional regulator n=1 Tax=Pseudonocardia sp. HH130630-07 TaxID=1690815 RepID=UPI0018D307AF|nr:MerR family transcriptional regulator [Pseudonocardia sp. HH130630-07]